jgi:hypothetical protein
MGRAASLRPKAGTGHTMALRAAIVLAFPLRFQGRKRVQYAAEITAEIVAKRLERKPRAIF